MKNLKLKELTKQELKEINGGDFDLPSRNRFGYSRNGNL